MQWPELRKAFLGANARTRFDARVRVLGPGFAEDAMNVPITVAAELPGVQRLMVLVDRNPIRKVLELTPAGRAAGGELSLQAGTKLAGAGAGAHCRRRLACGRGLGRLHRWRLHRAGRLTR